MEKVYKRTIGIKPETVSGFCPDVCTAPFTN